MKNLLVVFSCALMFTLALSSCDHAPTDSVDAVSVTEKFGGMDYFPNKVGSQWTYQVYDWPTAKWDTAVVTITGTHTLILPGDTLETTIWEHVWDYKADTQLVFKCEDSVLIYPVAGSRPIAKYMLPLEDGASWTYEHAYGLATTKLYASDTCSSCGIETFQNCFHYYTKVEGVAFDDESIYWGWLVPRVGTVWSHRTEEFNYTLLNKENWELLRYDRATGPR